MFGQVVKGMEVVKAVEMCGSRSGATDFDVVIADCGELPKGARGVGQWAVWGSVEQWAVWGSGAVRRSGLCAVGCAGQCGGCCEGTECDARAPWAPPTNNN